MRLFHQVPHEQAIIHKGGVYRQVDVFHRGSALYVGVGTGFVKLMYGGRTSDPRTSWIDLEEHIDVNQGGELTAPYYTGALA